jgi:hypothetical protein
MGTVRDCSMGFVDGVQEMNSYQVDIDAFGYSFRPRVISKEERERIEREKAEKETAQISPGLSGSRSRHEATVKVGYSRPMYSAGCLDGSE